MSGEQEYFCPVCSYEWESLDEFNGCPECRRRKGDSIAILPLDQSLASYVENRILTPDQALQLAETPNRHLATNGHAPAEFPRLKAARKGVR